MKWLAQKVWVWATLSVVAVGAAAIVFAACGSAASGKSSASPAAPLWQFVSAPNLNPPVITIKQYHPAAAAGDIFLAPITFGLGPRQGWAGPVILDSQGQPIWIRQAPPKQYAMNFQEQTYQGHPVLTWWQGSISQQGIGSGVDYIVGSDYKTIAVVHAVNGFSGDLHEFLITPQGTAYITAYKPVAMDLTSYGGPKNGTVWDSVVQEIDIKTGHLVFQWSPLQHVSLSQSYAAPAKGVWDPFHVNSVSLSGSTVLISARNTWTVYDVSHTTGAILWQLGGRQSSFTLGPGVNFAFQHDARFRSADSISVFDNEGAPQVASQSRGLVIELNFVNMTATLVHQYISPGVFAGSQGNVQLLPNGDAFVGWGQAPSFSEFAPTGQLLINGAFPDAYESYRAFRFAWDGRPAYPPALSITTASTGVSVHMSWNGATDVAGWRVLAGPDPSHLALVMSSPRTGFETTVTVSSAGPYYQVQAVDASGAVIGTSAVVRQ